jgi:hypothetical protein
MQPKRTIREILDSYGISTAPQDDPIYSDGHLLISNDQQDETSNSLEQEPPPEATA